MIFDDFGDIDKPCGGRVDDPWVLRGTRDAQTHVPACPTGLCYHAIHCATILAGPQRLLDRLQAQDKKKHTIYYEKRSLKKTKLYQNISHFWKFVPIFFGGGGAKMMPADMTKQNPM